MRGYPRIYYKKLAGQPATTQNDCHWPSAFFDLHQNQGIFDNNAVKNPQVFNFPAPILAAGPGMEACFEAF
jgi:hypothetical protein